MRAKYERWRSSGLMIPFTDFVNLGTHAQVRTYCIFLPFSYLSLDCTLAIPAYSNDVDKSQ